MTKEEKLAYLAGLVDGEGCIYITKSKGSYEMHLSIGNTERRMLKWIQDNFNGGLYLQAREKNGYKPLFSWIVSGRDASRLLKRIGKYLTVKGAQAELAIEFQRTAKHRLRNGIKLPLWMEERQKRYYLKLKEMHREVSSEDEQTSPFQDSTLNCPLVDKRQRSLSPFFHSK